MKILNISLTVVLIALMVWIVKIDKERHALQVEYKKVLRQLEENREEAGTLLDLARVLRRRIENRASQEKGGWGRK